MGRINRSVSINTCESITLFSLGGGLVEVIMHDFLDQIDKDYFTWGMYTVMYVIMGRVVGLSFDLTR